MTLIQSETLIDSFAAPSSVFILDYLKKDEINMKSNNIPNRRKFLARTVAAATAFSFIPGFTFAGMKNVSMSEQTHASGNKIFPGNFDFPIPCNPRSWSKLGIVIEPTHAWEGKFIQNFNSPAEPLGDGNWRIWYGVNPPSPDLPNIAIAEGRPGESMEKYQAVLSEGEPAEAFLSIGNLPEGWRPVQPVHLKLKDGRDRLYFWVHAPKQKVVRLLVADSSDGKRYRVIDPYKPCMYHFHDRAVDFVGVSPSGLKLIGKPEDFKKRFPRPKNEPAAPPELICNDGTSIYQLDDGTFEMYVISLISLERGDPRWAANDNLAGYIRVIDRLVSHDGLQWYGRQTVIKPDDLDPVDQQFYYLNVTYTPKGRVGMLGSFKTKDQTMDVEWCFSKDGIHWERPYRNRPWIERGWPGEPDSLGIYPPTQLVYDRDKWWLFYTGCNYVHNRKQSYGDPTSVVMVAKTSSIWQ